MLSFVSSRNSFHLSLGSIFHKSATLACEQNVGLCEQNCLGHSSGKVRQTPAWAGVSLSMAFLSGSQKFGEKGGETGPRCVTCTQADGIWVDQDPLQGLWGPAEMPPPPGPAAPRDPGGWSCFIAAPALVLFSVEGLVHSETTQHCSFFSSDTIQEGKSSGRGCII